MTATEVRPIVVAADALPDQFNVATYFVDRNVAEGRGDRVAIEYAARRITYREVLERVNRFGNALREGLDVRIGDRVLLLLLDCPEYAYAFFGAIKVGAVPIPTSTLLKPAVDAAQHLVRHCRFASAHRGDQPTAGRPQRARVRHTRSDPYRPRIGRGDAAKPTAIRHDHVRPVNFRTTRECDRHRIADAAVGQSQLFAAAHQ